MHIVPSMFIQKGKVVSLYKGSDNAQKKTYPKAPKSYAEEFQKQGADALFVVDLDGDQIERLKEIRAHFQGDIWWAGKVRSLEKIQACLDAGASHIVLGHSAKDIFQPALAQFGPQTLIAGLQIQRGDDAAELCEFLGRNGFTRAIVKDLNSEGTLFHPNFDLMEKCSYFSDLEVYASGGVAHEEDLNYLIKAGVNGVVIGRAFYEHRLSLKTLKARFGAAQ